VQIVRREILVSAVAGECVDGGSFGDSERLQALFGRTRSLFEGHVHHGGVAQAFTGAAQRYCSTHLIGAVVVSLGRDRRTESFWPSWPNGDR
jgi:hypothetical protein